MIPDEIRRELTNLLQGSTYIAGELTLASSGATTTVTRRGVSSTSIVSLTPHSANARTEGIPQVTAANGSFLLTHTAGIASRTYGYVVHTPQ